MKHPFRVALVVFAGLCGAAAATEHAGGADKVSCPRKLEFMYTYWALCAMAPAIGESIANYGLLRGLAKKAVEEGLSELTSDVTDLASLPAKAVFGRMGRGFVRRRIASRRIRRFSMAWAKGIKGKHIPDSEAVSIVEDRFPQFKQRVKQRFGVVGQTFEELFQADTDARRNLELFGGECACVDAETILMGPPRTRSAVIEELIHAEQNYVSVRGLTRVLPTSDPRTVSKFETVAAKLQVLGASKWRIPADEVKQIQDWLSTEIRQLDASDLVDVDADVKMLAQALGL